MGAILSYVFIAPAIILSTIVMGLLSLAVSLTGARENLQHRLARGWARLLLAVSFVEAEIEGMEKLDPARSYVLVANHASYMDTPVVLANIPLQFRFFAKTELFRIPLLGTHLARAGHFPVARGNPRASLKSMADGAKAIRERGVSVLVFPEGGRSPVELREFKEGAAYIAIKAGVPAVPVAIVGTRRILPMHSTRVRPGRVRLRIGDPIPTENLSIGDRDELTHTLRARISELIAKSA